MLMSINCFCVSSSSCHPKVLHFKSMVQKFILLKSLCVHVSRVSYFTAEENDVVAWLLKITKLKKKTNNKHKPSKSRGM